MIRPTLAAASIMALLSACAPPTATVSDFNGDSVKIQSNQMADAELAKANATAEANRICAKGHKKRAEYASTRQLPNYISEHLFLCLE
ncbi:hypothetical protein [Paracoccus aestuariivivens]|uniref:Lipoprotein n=1 Tax=Paracoccus aestuariivivens TaxID=1820333 RepID=A0A6L6J436_9RHOB|nr:hypothetical protein [Paracoccus aestuariivivens]MTH76326.1 hypothetical protein [Paracoccus aestuariivivens]